MVLFPVNPSLGDNTAVGAVSAQAGTTMTVASEYLFMSDSSCYLAQGANPTASAADGSMLVPAGVPVLLQGRNGAKIAVIQSGATGGNCSLTRIAV